MSTTLRLTEIYPSIQGESTWAGLPCTFVRLTGCPLRCVWCDTTYAFTGGEMTTVDAVVQRVTDLGVNLVEVTGGEPLAQPAAIDLMQALVDRGHTVLLETSGAFSIERVPREVHAIVDMKCPDSGELARNDYGNVARLRPHDEVKFVIASRRDYDWARDLTREHGLTQRCRAVLISPAWGLVSPADMAAWVLEDRWFDVRFQLQLHKVVWEPSTRGV